MTRWRKWAVVIAAFVALMLLSAWLGVELGTPAAVIGGAVGGVAGFTGYLWAEGYERRRSWHLHPWQAWLTYSGLRDRQHEGRTSGGRREAWLMARAVQYRRLRPRYVAKGHDVVFAGPCPFLTCLETGLHRHPTCPRCGAMRYGNLFCSTCIRNRHREDVTT